MNDQWKIETAPASVAVCEDAPPDLSPRGAGTNSLRWFPAASAPTLRPGLVHLWRANLDLPAVDAFRETLSLSEIIRAEAFHADRDRNRFIAAHGILRMTLARYLDVEADLVRFAVGAFGKPSLAGIASCLRFNLSHSGDLALIAVAHQEIGVDVEQVREDLPFDEIAENYFEPEEIWQIRTLRGLEKARKFFGIWTSKESRLKASGAGIGNGLSPAAGDVDRWQLRKFSIINAPTFGVAKEYAGAIAAEGKDWRMECWEWHN